MNFKTDFRMVALGLCILAIALRLVPHDYNVSAICALGMLLGCFGSPLLGFVVALAAMAASDVLGEVLGIPSMGFYAPWLMLTVYLAMASSALVGRFVVGLRDGAGHFRIPLWAGVPLGAVVSSVLFFLVTNFASWLDPQMGYPLTLTGLAECYWAALPFAKNTLVGNLVYSALFFGGYAFFRMPTSSPVDVR
ncbi:MAG: hypothetical protein NXI32_24525 [bacterium]|nr:hypothetical protein [bacterium]